MSFRRSNLGFFVLQGLFWASYCPLFGYVVTILRHYGYSAEVCGTVTTLQCIAMMVIQPVYGYIVDRFTTPKRGFIIIMSVGVVLALPLVWVFEQAAWFAVLYLTLLGMFVYSAGPVVDTWTVGVINKTRGMDYALCRGGGSMMYAVTALVTGNLISKLGIEMLFTIHIVLGAAAVIVATQLVDSAKLEQTGGMRVVERKEQLGFVKSARVLLRNREYLLFTVCMCLFNFGTRPYSTYMALVLENVGGDSSHMGVSLFISAFGELVFMLVASRMILRGMPSTYLYMLALGILAARFYIMGFSTSLWVIIITQVIQAVGFGFNLRINVEYLVHTAPEGYHGMAIMLSGAISIAFGCVLGNFLGGYMINWWGVQNYVLICATVLLLNMLIFLPTVLREHRERKQMRLEYMQQMAYNSNEQE